MGLFDFLKKQDMHRGMEMFRNTPGAVLLDVRTLREYRQRHIPGCIHLPIPELDRIERWVPDRQTPIFIYCHSGQRARQATKYLQKLGYCQVVSIGGIAKYTGPTE